MMKILIIMPWIKQGGAEITAIKTACQLQRLGHQVGLVALFVDVSKMREEVKGIDYVSLPKWLGKFLSKHKFWL